VHRIINVEENKTLRLLAIGIVRPEPGRYTISTRPAPYELALDNVGLGSLSSIQVRVLQ